MWGIGESVTGYQLPVVTSCRRGCHYSAVFAVLKFIVAMVLRDFKTKQNL